MNITQLDSNVQLANVLAIEEIYFYANAMYKDASGKANIHYVKVFYDENDKTVHIRGDIVEGFDLVAEIQETFDILFEGMIK